MRSKIDTFSKSILLSIQQLQNQFQDVGRLKRVTDNLELLSQAINFDDLWIRIPINFKKKNLMQLHMQLIA